jgi:5'-nucleotidase
MKKYNYFILSLCFLALAGRPATAQENDSDAREVVILAVNDMHSAVEMFPRLGGVVDSVRALYPDLLLFSAGDNRTGNPINDRYAIPGFPVVDMMNIMRFDASAIGNHEFDSNIGGFRNLIFRSNFPYLCANISAPDTMRLFTSPYRFYERNGIRIGVLGLIQLGPMGIPDSHPNNLKGLAFRQGIEMAQEFLWMREQCDILILLTHLGYEDDLLLAETFPEADVIIGGHSHTVVGNRVLKNGIIVTQTGKSLKFVTELKLEVSGNRVTAKNAKLIDLNATLQRSPAIQTALDGYTTESAKTLNTVLAIAETPFDNKDELGWLMADAHRSLTDADISLQNEGGVRYPTHAAGDFTMKDAYSLDPFGNELYVYELTGLEVEQAIASSWGIEENPYVSGITYTVTKDANVKQVKKVVVLLDGKPINPTKTFRVTMNSYLASVCPSIRDKQVTLTTGISATDALVEYLQKQKTVSYQGEKRITVKN